MKGGLKGSETVVLEHVQKGLVNVNMLDGLHVIVSGAAGTYSLSRIIETKEQELCAWLGISGKARSRVSK